MRNEFNVIDSPLCGRKLIEASAGTGKTYSLIHIVLRLIVEERIPIERLLLVTFTKAATAELKMRVRELLIRAQQAYEDCRDDDTRYDPTLIALIKKWRQAKIDPSVFKMLSIGLMMLRSARSTVFAKRCSKNTSSQVLKALTLKSETIATFDEKSLKSFYERL